MPELEMTEEEFARLESLVGSIREDFAGHKGQVLALLEGFRRDLGRLVGQLDGLAGAVDRLADRVGRLEAWRAEREAVMVQANQIVEAKRQELLEARRGRRYVVGWVIAILGPLIALGEWLWNTFRLVRR